MKQISLSRKNNTGFTLIELMIAIVISMILMLGVMQIFGSNKRSHVIGTGLARVQENIRFAMKEINFAMRMAGYVGCSGNVKNLLDPAGLGYDPDLYDFKNATGGWEFSNGAATSVTAPGETYTLTDPASYTPSTTLTQWDNNLDDDLPATLDGRVLPGTDVVVLKWAGGNTGVKVKKNTANNATITTQTSSTIPQGAILMVSDCSGGDVFQNTANANASTLTRGSGASGAQPGNLTPGPNNWSHVYSGSADILYFMSRAFYVGLGASGEPSLFRITYSQGTSGQAVEEIAEGIENMQVLYGIDVTSDDYADRFVTAKDVTGHDKVVTLKIGILARTPNEVKKTAATGTYNLLGTTINTPSDRRVRYVFNTTVKLRNKGKK